MYRLVMRIFLVVLASFLLGCIEVQVNRPLPIKLQSIKKICKKDPAIVAVIDTGLSLSAESAKAKLCKIGHTNFTADPDFVEFPGINNLIPKDNNGHGTNIAGAIQNNAGDANYCMIILKFYSPKSRHEEIYNTIRAIEFATKIGAKYINYSAGGNDKSQGEKMAVKKFLDKGGIFIAAAGNERNDIDKVPYYPAMDDKRVISVGSIDKDGTVSYFSNYGKSVKKWEHGYGVYGFGTIMGGTSQAAAVYTGKLLKNNEKCDK